MSGPVHDSEVAGIPEDLPPVQPPSAGFIVQLFVIPALIVMAIMAVWLLFGRLASGEQDWRELVVELRHTNPHRRWRAAHGLAQLLNADQRGGMAGERLSANRELALALANVLQSELERGGQTDEDLKHEAFLARTLGLFDLPDVVFPALQQGLQPGNDPEVRKNALGAIAVLTDRMATAKTGGPSDLFVPDLLTAAGDADPVLRRLTAFTLGFFPQEAAVERLDSLLDDGDKDTQINAAIGLARQGDPRGERVFREVLESATRAAPAAGQDEYERFVALKNVLTAIERLAPKFDADRRQALIAQIKPIADGYREPKIRIVAQQALTALEAAKGA